MEIIVVDIIAQYVIPLIGAVISALVMKTLYKFEQKTGIDINEKKEKLIKDIFVKTVLAVSEEAASLYKRNDQQIKMSSYEKLKKVRDAGLAEIKKLLPKEKITEEKATKYIHAAIAGIKGEGATGSNVSI